MTRRPRATAGRIQGREAIAYKRMFVVARDRTLRRVAAEQQTQRKAMTALRRLYDKLLATWLRREGTTYEAWLEHGPKAEYDELVAAAEVPAVWDRLVDRIAASVAHVGAA